MARNKESLLLLIDVGPSMHSVLRQVETVCSLLMEKKLIYSKYDEVGAILFGTADTENELTKEVGGYEHIVVLQNIRVVDGVMIEALQQLPRGTAESDYLDAIVVGLDMMLKKYQLTNKGKKRLCLITNAICPIKDPYEGTKEEQVHIIAEQMSTHGIKLESIVVRGKLTEFADQRIIDENDSLLSIFSEKTSARTVYVDSPTSLLGALRTRNITPVTTFRGDLEISPLLKIKVWVYKKTFEEKFPTLKKFSDKAPLTDRFATHEVKVDYEYKSVEDSSKVVPPEQRIKGYRYGPQVVPISSAEWDAVKFKPEKGAKILGFTDASNILRHYYMKDVNIFVAEPNNTRSIIAVSALARAMKQLNKVAILRCVWRQGQGSVIIGVLTPNVSEKENVPDSFYFNVLPYAEDVREFQFPSFSSFPASWQPNEKQQEVADNLVKMLDLAPSGKEEALLPDFIPNPVLERFYHHLELKSMHPDVAVPPLDETLKRIIEPDPQLLTGNISVIDEFCKSFDVKENPKLKKSTKRLFREKPTGSDGEEGNGDATKYVALNLDENKPLVKVEKIGDFTPVQDFEAMMSRRDNPDLVGKAIKEMKSKIQDLLENHDTGNSYSKVLDYLVALRKGCVIEQEPKQFNDFFRQLIMFCQTKDFSSFCELLALKGLTLVSTTEAIDSDVTDDDARSFQLGLKRDPESE